MSQISLVCRELQSIDFSVKGDPICQGSKVARITGRRIRKGGNVYVLNPNVSLIESGNMKTKTMPSGRLKDWRDLISFYASAMMGGRAPWIGPVILNCEFIMPRRRSHYTDRGALKKSAPMVPTKDFDKLLRAVGDALSGIVYKDDVQIVGIGPRRKRFADKLSAVGGARIQVSQV